MIAELIAVGDLVARELMLFAAVGFLVGGISDLALDLIWIGRSLWRRATIYRSYARVTTKTLPEAGKPGRIAIFVPAWDEGPVIGPMLAHALATLDGRDARIYVGVYPNDPATLAAVRGIAAVRIVICDRPGPTTKADCLNALWRALLDDEAREGRAVKAVVLHDAEDVLHSAEHRIFDRMIERFDLVQLPVLPLIDPQSRWVGGHYLDEFAEAHGKMLTVREALGAAVPSAGVGCAISRAMLGRIADLRGGLPFDADSLTEDYELGLRVAELGGRSAFVRLPGERGVVAVRAHFPGTLDAAVRQKARWIAGIALSGWDRLGWRGGFAERWMRLHDRRALLAAAVLLAAYTALLVNGAVGTASNLAGIPLTPLPDALATMLLVSAFLLFWRLFVRAFFTTRAYGWREGARSIPRALLANVIALMAARRAVTIYRRSRRDGVVRWDKTDHQFPAVVGAE